MIVSVLRHYGATVPDRAGRFAVKCCFHTDSVASGWVDVRRDCYKCMACGVSGDAVSLVMQQEGVSRDAAKRLAKELVGASDRTVREVPQPRGTYISLRARDQRLDSKKVEDRRRRFPFA